MSPVGLSQLLASLPRGSDPNLLVGFETADDAAVYRLDDETALVVTADYITPPVDDPRIFGKVAAANALSDIYAMGGQPLLCLSLVGFPMGKLPLQTLQDILRGAAETVEEAGAVLAGGHSTDDREPKYGLAVVGRVHPQRIWRNVGARPGDALILTKPIGSGVLLNANRAGRLPPGALDPCLAVMMELNARAARVLGGYSVHAATDVTGFGLAGHALGMAEGPPGVSLVIEAARVPVFGHALRMYERGVTTGMNRDNRLRARAGTRFAPGLGRPREELFVDPQTSGGLLVALPAAEAEAAVGALQAAGVSAATVIGRVEGAGQPLLSIG